MLPLLPGIRGPLRGVLQNGVGEGGEKCVGALKGGVILGNTGNTGNTARKPTQSLGFGVAKMLPVLPVGARFTRNPSVSRRSGTWGGAGGGATGAATACRGAP